MNRFMWKTRHVAASIFLSVIVLAGRSPFILYVCVRPSLSPAEHCHQCDCSFVIRCLLLGSSIDSPPDFASLCVCMCRLYGRGVCAVMATRDDQEERSFSFRLSKCPASPPQNQYIHQYTAAIQRTAAVLEALASVPAITLYGRWKLGNTPNHDDINTSNASLNSK